MAKIWNVHVGEEHEGNVVDHQYESPKDALKVAKRYVAKRRRVVRATPCALTKQTKMPVCIPMIRAAK